MSPPATPTTNHFKGEKNPSKVFTRAESFASDAQIVDKLQRMQLAGIYIKVLEIKFIFINLFIYISLGGDSVNNKRMLDFSEANSTEDLDKTDDDKKSPTM